MVFIITASQLTYSISKEDTELHRDPVYIGSFSFLLFLLLKPMHEYFRKLFCIFHAAVLYKDVFTHHLQHVFQSSHQNIYSVQQMLISRETYRHALCAPSNLNLYSSANGSQSENNIKLKPIEQKHKANTHKHTQYTFYQQRKVKVSSD